MVFKRDSELVVFDGAIGTEVQKRAPDVSENLTEILNLKQPETIQGIHEDYLKAGADFLTTNTFSANRVRLDHSNYGDRLTEINEKGVQLARQAIKNFGSGKDQLFVAGSIGPTGETLVPLGDSTFTEFYDVFYNQALALKNGGADWLIIETMESLREAKAALVAALEVDLPVISSLSYGERGRTSYGVKPAPGAVTLDRLGCEVLAMNCGTGPAHYPELIDTYRKFTDKPILAEANAGTPELRNEEVIYDLTPEEYLEKLKPGLPYLSGVGSCCGSDPSFTKLLAGAASEYEREPKKTQTEKGKKYISNNSTVLAVTEETDFTETRIGKGELTNFTEKLEGDRVNMLNFTDISDSAEEFERKLARGFLRLRSGKPAGIVTGQPELLKTFLMSYPGISPVRATSNGNRIRKVAERYGGMLI